MSDRRGSAKLRQGAAKVCQANALSNVKDRAKKLPFVDCSIAQIQEAIALEDPSCSFHEHFWQTLLTEHPPPDAQPLKNRTLCFWIRFWNKWQEKNEKQGFTETMNVPLFEELFPMDRSKQGGVIRLFDPEGYKRMRQRGQDVNAQRMVAMPIAPFLTAGVMLSQLISTNHKLRFIFGIVDANGNKALEEPEFFKFIHNFIAGLGGAFGLLGQVAVMPSKSCIDTVAKRLFERVSDISAKRVRELLKAGIRGGDDKVIKAVRQSIREKLNPSTAPTCAPIRQVSGCLSVFKQGQVVPFQVLFEWCYRALRDPLALPYALTVERFCPHRQGGCEIADEFDDELGEFRVVPGQLIPEPVSDQTDLDPNQGKLLLRGEVIQAHLIFQYVTSSGSFQDSLREVEKELDIQIADEAKSKFTNALRRLGGSQNQGLRDLNTVVTAEPEFLDFLRCLCPAAKPKHLRMFDSWVQQYSAIEMEEEDLDFRESIAEKVMRDNDKPPLPLDEISALKAEFERIDTSGNGIIEPSEIAAAWGWGESETAAAIAKYDVMADGCIDVDEFLRMMCPEEYRLPESFGTARDLLGKMLKEATAANKEDCTRRRSHFASQKTSVGKVSATPVSLLPEVSETMWNEWVSTFKALDKNGNGSVELSELEQSGYFPREVCRAIMDTIKIVPGANCFSLDGFLGAMLTIHHVRRKGFIH